MRDGVPQHLLTAPRSPTTTGKIERFHRTLRQEFLTGRVFTDLATAQAELDAWVDSYNRRPAAFGSGHGRAGQSVPRPGRRSPAR